MTGYLPPARRLASRFHNRGVSLADLTNIASIGLVHTVDRFDPQLGSPFLGFGIPTIQGESRAS